MPETNSVIGPPIYAMSLSQRGVEWGGIDYEFIMSRERGAFLRFYPKCNILATVVLGVWVMKPKGIVCTKVYDDDGRGNGDLLKLEIRPDFRYSGRQFTKHVMHLSNYNIITCSPITSAFTSSRA